MMRAMDHGDVGSRIRLRRQELGWTQSELADRVDVHTATVRAWELNRNFPGRHQGRLEAVLRIRLDGSPWEDPEERKLWALNLPTSTKRELVAHYRMIGRRQTA